MARQSSIDLRHEVQRLHEETLAAALSKKTDPRKEYGKNFGLGPFGNLPKKARKILDCSEDWEVLRRMLRNKHKWIRPVKEWSPRGKSMTSILTSLINHLFCEYKMPAFWFSVWYTRAQHRAVAADGVITELDTTLLRDINLFIELAQGQSLYKLVKTEKFILPFTKKQCHAFMAQRGVKNVVSAARWTQIQTFGGDRRLAQVICNTGWGDSFASGPRSEAFRAGVIQWFCNQGMIDPVQVGPLIDFIDHSRTENPEWSLKGRTGQSLMRAMQDWHDGLAAQRATIQGAARKPPPEKFDPCGVGGWRWNRKSKDKRTGKVTVEHWKIEEILTYEDLRTEGRDLRHCVASYAWSLARGDKAIFSLQCNHERRLTIEVHVPTKTIVQARGLLNKKAEPYQVDLMRRWANDEGITLAERALMRAW